MKKIFFILFIHTIAHAQEVLRLAQGFAEVITQQPEQPEVHPRHAHGVPAAPEHTTCMECIRSYELRCLGGSCACSSGATIGLGAATLCSPTNTLPLLGGTIGSGALTLVLACTFLNRGCQKMSCDRLRFWGS